MTPLPAYFATVNSAPSAVAFLSALHEAGLAFHPDENPFDCLRPHGLPTVDLLTINANMAACFAYLPDPCETALQIATD